jgi:deoxyadenosine/deoxycytidine kinase
MAKRVDPSLKIGLVGPCAAGKTTLAAQLRLRGFTARHIAQEHSYVAYMWQRITNPDILIYLSVSYENTLKRRQMNWTVAEYEEQLYRLRHALVHADLILDTDPLTPDEVLEKTLSFLEGK